MLVWLKRIFADKTEPRTHLEILIEEARRTGDGSRLIADSIVSWAWARYKNEPNAAEAPEFLEHLALIGYKPISDLSDDEKRGVSPKKLLVCEALEGIKENGSLEAKIGHVLRHLSETGEIEKSFVCTLEPSGCK